MTDILILPGIGNSGAAHWQTRWQQAEPDMRRFAPADWDRPELADWCAALERAVAAAQTPPVLVAHSLACLTVAHWQQRSSRPVAGAFLVGVPDPAVPVFPPAAAEFAGYPTGRLRFPSLMIASSDDPYASLAFARERAAGWGSGCIDIGPAGHINGDSGLGDWRYGRDLLAAFIAGAGPASAAAAH